MQFKRFDPTGVIGIIIAVLLAVWHDGPSLALFCAIILFFSVLSLLAKIPTVSTQRSHTTAAVFVSLLVASVFRDIVLNNLTPPPASELVNVSVDERQFPIGQLMTVVAAPLAGKTIYNVDGQCVGFSSNHEPQGVLSESDVMIQPLPQELNSIVRDVGMVTESLASPHGIVAPLAACALLDPANGKIVTEDRLGDKNYKKYRCGNEYIFVLAYSVSPSSPEQFATYGITFGGIQIGLPTYAVAPHPKTTYTECCETAVRADLARRVDYYRSN